MVLTLVSFTEMEAEEKRQWAQVRKTVRANALIDIGDNRTGVNTMRIADSVVDNARAGLLILPHGTDAEMIEFLRVHVKARIDEKVAAVKERLAQAVGISTPRQRRLKQRARQKRNAAEKRAIRDTMDVKKVIENLPTIALLIGRLNELLNPIANPEGGE